MTTNLKNCLEIDMVRVYQFNVPFKYIHNVNIKLMMTGYKFVTMKNSNSEVSIFVVSKKLPVQIVQDIDGNNNYLKNIISEFKVWPKLTNPNVRNTILEYMLYEIYDQMKLTGQFNNEISIKLGNITNKINMQTLLYINRVPNCFNTNHFSANLDDNYRKMVDILDNYNISKYKIQFKQKLNCNYFFSSTSEISHFIENLLWLYNSCALIVTGLTTPNSITQIFQHVEQTNMLAFMCQNPNREFDAFVWQCLYVLSTLDCTDITIFGYEFKNKPASENIDYFKTWRDDSFIVTNDYYVTNSDGNIESTINFGIIDEKIEPKQCTSIPTIESEISKLGTIDYIQMYVGSNSDTWSLPNMYVLYDSMIKHLLFRQGVAIWYDAYNLEIPYNCKRRPVDSRTMYITFKIRAPKQTCGNMHYNWDRALKRYYSMLKEFDLIHLGMDIVRR